MDLRVMSFNLRFENDQDLTQPWEMRKHLIVETVKELRPDVVGTQEGKLRQLAFLELALKDFRMVFQERTLDITSQYPTLFLKRSFEVLKVGEFWLSSTPKVHLSKDWNSAFPRMFSYAYIRHPAGEPLVFAVTHLDNRSALAREMQARMISRWVQDIEDLTILMGDFNESPDGKVHHILCNEGGFLDTWELLGGKEDNDSFSYHAFTGIGTLGRIDWILIRPSLHLNFHVKKAAFLRTKKGFLLPSDHFPYVVEIKIEKD